MDAKTRRAEIFLVCQKYIAIEPCLNERGRRLWAATESMSYGRGGISIVSKATGISDRTIRNGIKEVSENAVQQYKGVRRTGGGRKKLTSNDPSLLYELNKLVDPTARGDPESPLLWTTKSVRKLTDELRRTGHTVSFRTTTSLLAELGYSLQANKKMKEGSSHKDRDAQFHYINDCVSHSLEREQPVISVDTKKKENIGEYKNHGREYCLKGNPILVNTHDFPDKRLGKVVPYGVYDIGKNKGWVSVGINGDTAEFAVNTIRTWWYKMGLPIYGTHGQELIITADCGGSNGYRVKLWKQELQNFANETGLRILVRHFPPGTSKWNKIEHKMFSYISKNWRGKPLISAESVVSFIGATTTYSGLKIMAVLDKNVYKLRKKVSKLEMSSINITGDEFHPEWNYTISPQMR